MDERIEGISAYLRARDEEEFLAPTVESHLPFFDEICITVHDCTDATPEIAADLARRHPDRVRVAHYDQEIAMRSSKEHLGIPDDSPRSYANYCNWAMCQTRCKIIARIDADHLAIPSEMGTLVEHVRENLKHGVDLGFSGINWFPIGGQQYIKREDALTFGDHSFFWVTEKTWFHYDEKFGSAHMHAGRAGLEHELWQPSVFHHCKCLKRDGYKTYDTSNTGANVHRVAKADAERDRSGVMSLWEAKRRLPERFPQPASIYGADLKETSGELASLGSPTPKERLKTLASQTKRTLKGSGFSNTN